MPTVTASVTTSDGTCPVWLHTPNGTGPWSGLILYPDAGGARATMHDMADTMAGFGYAVLVPDVYYRHGDWEPFSMATAFSDPDERTRLMGMVGSVTPDMYASDAGAFIDFLLGRPEVKGDAVGVFGYCMGGRASVIVAGRHPDRVAAAGSIHGGRLVTDDPDSPHLLADRMTAEIYVGAAENDHSYTPEQSDILAKALQAAGVTYEIEWYHAGHGFAVPDNPPYDPKAAEQHWLALRRLFDSALGD